MRFLEDWQDKGNFVIGLGTDHGGFVQKNNLIKKLNEQGIKTVDYGPFEYDKNDDYSDFAYQVAKNVQLKNITCGILFCTTGNGMAMTANKFHGVRAALCVNSFLAQMSRAHNDSNILVIGAKGLDDDAVWEIVRTWLETPYSNEERHSRRLIKMDNMTLDEDFAIRLRDPEIAAIIAKERDRQNRGIELIASENIVSPAVRAAAGSILTNKYAEGYPAHRYYNGCAHMDEIESIAIERACKLFGAEAANVQPHAGSQANMAAYNALIEPGDTVLAMRLDMGGHLTHGYNVNFSGKTYNFIGYGVRPDTETIDYDEVERLALENKPKLILAGASAYPRIIDFPRLRAIADKVGAYFMVDMAHIAGLVAAGEHPSPVPYCDIVTTTTHKTLRGPRGGLILCKKELLKKVNSAVFPGMQGGPLMHIIAAKAVCLQEAMSPDFKAYQHQVRLNATALAAALAENGFRIVSGGTDNHLMLVDLRPKNISGKDASTALDKADITANMNMIPFDPAKPTVTSGVRIGTPAVTTRGMKEPEMKQIADWIARVVENYTDDSVLAKIREEVHALTAQFPVPQLIPADQI